MALDYRGGIDRALCGQRFERVGPQFRQIGHSAHFKSIRKRLETLAQQTLDEKLLGDETLYPELLQKRCHRHRLN